MSYRTLTAVFPRMSLALVTAALTLLGAPDARADWQVWVESSSVKILSDHPPGDGTLARFGAARNEWEAFQIAVRDETDPIVGLDLEITDLLGPDGARLEIPRTHVYREWIHTVDNASECFFVPVDCSTAPPELQRNPGGFPDALVPFADPYDEAHPPVGAPFDVPAGVSQALFIDVYVPPDTPPGSYEAELRVMAEGREPVTIQVDLTVWDVRLPDERRVATTYGFSNDRVPHHHGGPDGDPEALARIERNYLVAMRDHRMDVRGIKGPVSFEFDEDGNLLPVDWTAYDAAVAPKLDGTYWPDGRPPVRFDTRMFTPGRSHGSYTDDQWAKAAAALAEHLQERGWLERAFVYSADEPFLPNHQDSYVNIPKDVELLNRYTDLWKGRIMVTNPIDERLIGSIDIWCPVTPMYDTWYYGETSGFATREQYQERLALGEELWFYACNANFPGWAGYDLDAPLGHEPRIVKWGAWFEGATGFLYWRMNYWYDEDPWNHFANFDNFGEVFARNGDGVLYYPGDHDGTAGSGGSPEGISMDGPALSYRMKMARDGLEDWEMFIIAQESGAGDYAREQVGTVYRQFGAHLFDGSYDVENPPWTVDAAPLLTVRRKIAEKIQHLGAPDLYPDPEAVPVSPEPGAEVVGVDVAEPADEEVIGADTPEPDGSGAVAEPATGGDDGGSGGCTMGLRGNTSAGGYGALLLLFALGALALRRRRTHQAY